MTRAITPNTVLKAIDRRHPWYGTRKTDDGIFYHTGIQINYQKFYNIMRDEKITFNERTIKHHWKQLFTDGYYEEFYDEDRGVTLVTSVPDAIAKELRVKMTYWMPMADRMRSSAARLGLQISGGD